MKNVSVVIPNWNGKYSIAKCIDSLLIQPLEINIIVVENGSVDGSLEYIQKKYGDIDLVVNNKNLGFSGGVNSGIRKSIELKDEYVLLLNNDAIADKNWAKNLVNILENDPGIGIATSKILTSNGEKIDSTGDFYTVWGLPYPRGRGENNSDKYNKENVIFAASGGASIYRVSMLKDIGLFDEDFFAYYEDVDISFRAQLAGWKVSYVPEAIVYHQIGATSSKVKGFTTYQTMKNLPWLAIKNVPAKYLPGVLVRLSLAQTLFWARAVTRHQGIPATRGWLVSVIKMPKKLLERRKIQKSRQVNDKYIWAIMIHDLPPNASALRILRSKWWRVSRRNNAHSN
jgi:GT2 family glycosyltransferase